MESKKSKTLILNTLLLLFCVVVITLFCFGPSTNDRKVLESYNIIFDSDGGTSIAAIKIDEGGVISQPEAPTKDGYIFVGWMLDDEIYDFASSVTGDVTLKAKWEEKKPDVVYYTINFSTSGGSLVTPITVEAGTAVVEPYPPTRDGFTFKGWQLNGLTYDFSQPVNGDLTLVAVWEVIQTEPDIPEDPDVTTFKVKFNLNGGTGGNAKTQTIEGGKKASKPSKNPTRSGYTFVGWYLDGKAYDFGTAVTKDITLVAQWQEVKVPTYNVDFYTYSGSWCGYVNVESGKTAALPSNCKASNRKGYKFIGWNTNSKATSANFVPGSTKVTSNMKVYQIYQEIVYNVSCTKPDAYSQTCKLSVSGATGVSSVSVVFKGTTVKANTTQDGSLSLTYAVWEQASSVSVVIDGVTYKGKKVN